MSDKWMEKGVCFRKGPEVTRKFFSSRYDEAREAKAMCYRCPVRTKCLNYALEYEIEYGTWGGKTEEERQRIGDGHKQFAERACKGCGITFAPTIRDGQLYHSHDCFLTNGLNGDHG